MERDNYQGCEQNPHLETPAWHAEQSPSMPLPGALSLSGTFVQQVPRPKMRLVE
jgi:hypothetical protein